jgi:hypothetical protein
MTKNRERSVNKSKRSLTIMRNATCAFVIFTLFAYLGGVVSAQTRVSDKDIEAMMKNLKEDAKKFTSSFNSGITRSSIRGTSREKDSKSLVKRLQQQTEGMLNNFKRNKKAEAEMEVVLRSAGEIDKLLNEVKLDQNTGSSWEKLQEELGLLSKALGVPKEPAQQ